MQRKVILDSKKFSLTIDRLCFQLFENHYNFENTVIIGIQPRGIHLSNRIVKRLKELKPSLKLEYGVLDITFHRDDFGRRDTLAVANETQIDFMIEDKKVILIDDVLYTGRTIRAALDALLGYGRPNHVELLTLIDRRFSRDLPIEANFVGKTVDSIASDLVKVEWKEQDGADKVWILTTDKKDK